MYHSKFIPLRLFLASIFLTMLLPKVSAQFVRAWGDNGVGQINVPVAAQGRITKISAGYYFSLGLKPDGGVVAWGDNSYGELNIPVAAQAGVTNIAAGVLHALAIKNGGVIAWGSNERGEINVPGNALEGVTAIAAGEYFSLAVKNGGVFGWGNNDYGVLNIPSAATLGVEKISAGSYHVVALKNGGVIGWGMDVAGSLQMPVTALSGVVDVQAGYLHNLALKADGSVVAWGWNSRGQCDVPAAAQSGVVAIDAGYDFSMALKADGTLIMWGDNDYGWLNIPSGALPLVAVSSSAYHTMALKAESWATLDFSEIESGSTVTGTVHLAFSAPAGGTTVNLTSDTAGVYVPASVVVPEGAAEVDFVVTTDYLIGADLNALIRASYDNTPTVPAPLKVTSIPINAAFNRASVVGGSTTKAQLTLTIGGILTGDLTLDLSSSDSAIMLAPTSAVIPAGQNSITVPVTHNIVTSSLGQSVTLNVSYGGALQATASILITPIRATITLADIAITSGDSTYAFATLNAIIRTPVVLNIPANHPDVSSPSSVTIRAGGMTAFFPVDTVARAVDLNYPVAVSINGNTFSRKLTIEALPAVRTITLAKSTIGNTRVTGSFTLTRPARAGGEVITLSANGGLSVPASILVAEGQSTANFDVVASDVSTNTPGQVIAASSVNDITKTIAVLPMVPVTLTASTDLVNSGGTFTCTVTLNQITESDTQVDVSTSNAYLSVPATVTIPAGNNSVTFTAQAATPSILKRSKITATKNGKNVVRVITIQP